MKLNQLMLSLMIGSTALSFSACKKKGCTNPLATNYNAEANKDDGSCILPDPTPVITTPFTAKIDGVEFVENALTATIAPFTQTLNIEATRTDGRKVRITMPSNITVGTYTFTNPDGGSQCGYYHDGTSNYGAPTGTGTLQIVSHDTATDEISGIFSFSAQPYAFSSGSATYSVSEGQFKVTY